MYFANRIKLQKSSKQTNIKTHTEKEKRKNKKRVS